MRREVIATLLFASVSLAPTISAAQDLRSAARGIPQSETPAPDSNASGDRAGYLKLVKAEAKQEGLPSEIADSVMAVESGYNPAAIGTSGEIGLMQILPTTARMMGFAGSNLDLAIPETNIHYGVAYLAGAWRLAASDICTAVMKYRAGYGETRFSYRSVDYCVAVRGKLSARNYPVTGDVPVATFGEPGSLVAGEGCRRHCLGGAVAHVDLAALNTRLSALVAQIHFGK
ncbi:MAG: transglycosylase SLT domain-containing protein [Methylovirgula sp.]|uniref:lytic transglycosylase domain-containing protein n=1 Tax=Methylovirgula sp. TaxID=1978224 RepID=UPI003076105A